MKYNFMRTLLLGTALLATGSAMAHVKPYAGFTVGMNSLKGRWTSDSQIDQKRIAFDKVSTLGASVLFGVEKAHGKFVYGAELDIGTGTGTKGVNFADPGDDRQIIDTKMTFLSHARLILGYKVNKFTPYVGIGLSGAKFNFDLRSWANNSRSELTTKNTFGVGSSVSVGIKYDMCNKWSLRAEGGQDIIGSISVPAFGEMYVKEPKINFFRVGITMKL